MFRGRKPIVELNVHAIDQAYRYALQRFEERSFHLSLGPGGAADGRLYINGSEAVAMGKMAAGLAFQTYYPISPATAENTFLERHTRIGREGGGDQAVVVVQTEDEIAAITMAAGAALTGVRASTATSGPGFSLMTEGLGWVGINEVPLVVTLWQRGGPSTGLPTRTEQGDLLSALHAGHGEFPRILMASSDLEGGVRGRCAGVQLRRALPAPGHPPDGQGAVQHHADPDPLRSVHAVDRPRRAVRAERPRAGAGVFSRASRSPTTASRRGRCSGSRAACTG